jgi:hypothetical protein
MMPKKVHIGPITLMRFAPQMLNAKGDLCHIAFGNSVRETKSKHGLLSYLVHRLLTG